MAILVAVTDNEEGRHALRVAADEASAMRTELIVVNLTLGGLDVSELDAELAVRVIDRAGRADRDPATAVLDEIDAHPEVTRLVIGIKRRSRVGKALLGSITQRLLMMSPVPVLSVQPS
ncbi:universal stress protein [Rhodococcus sp. 06-412-2C]|uniref:universal stress protein n=1 Tax=unclassified Rhodococcus (in: high G+C Gram-positive bacteria) TaxID=192944 RepID=UPI000B9C5A44|nr:MULTISPECIES: universal stress protein [unclassified Rhodococcus (in: high G+C Gram-positive bacteria)]OZC87128.1 universal stress protein [Rhodococcus sp. 06-412-2C]OZD00569.1 universal stress protein [Rhodococcus sp. 06-412-2B]